MTISGSRINPEISTGPFLEYVLYLFLYEITVTDFSLQ